jgi:hypothetical protein
VLAIGFATVYCVSDPDRHQPLPALPALPRWLWRRMGRWTRLVVVLALLAVPAGALALVPSLRESRQEADARLQRERAEQRARLVRRLRAEQRPVRGRSDARAPAGASAARRLALRAQLMRDMRGAIGVDARARVRRGDLDGPIRRVTCEPFPRSVDGAGADRDLGRRRGRFACVAVTAEFEGGVIGHPYRTRVDFHTGRFAFCKTTGRAGPEREQLVTVPRACGGNRSG